MRTVFVYVITLRNDLEEHSFQLLRDGSLKSPIIAYICFSPSRILLASNL